MVVTIVTAAEFPSYAPDAKTAVVRIYDPTEDWQQDIANHSDDAWRAVLPLAFWDVGMEGLGLAETLLVSLLGRHRNLCLWLGQKLFGDDIPWRPFLAADACELRRFADRIVTDGIQSVLVVCNNGRSRSWTVARWLAGYLGAEAPHGRGWQRESDLIARTLAACDKQERATARPLSLSRI